MKTAEFAEKIRQESRIARFAPFLAASAFLFGTPLANAGDQASLSLGYRLYGKNMGTSLVGTGGFVASFISETQSNFIRPVIGMTLESGGGAAITNAGGGTTQASVILGSVLAGGHFFFFKTTHIRPFFSLYGSLGWGQATWDGETSMGLVYGPSLGGGVELRWKDDPKSRSIRISTLYSLGMNTFAFTGLDKFEFDNLQFSIGLTF